MCYLWRKNDWLGVGASDGPDVGEGKGAPVELRPTEFPCQAKRVDTVQFGGDLEYRQVLHSLDVGNQQSLFQKENIYHHGIDFDINCY